MIRILFAAVCKPQLQLSTRHTKGISTLVLLILAESLSLSNAVNLWSIYDSYHYRHEGAEAFSTRNQKPNQFARTYRKAEECLEARPSSASPISGCPLPPSLPPTRLFPGTRLAIGVTNPYVARPPSGECRVECAKCSSPPDMVQNGSNIPRGGHSVTAPAPRDLLDAAANAAGAATGFAELTPYGIPLTGWKVIFQIILTAINVFCWLVPLRSKKMSENKFALSLANAFSGGVFLSLAFGHLIPECIHGFEGFNEVTPYMLVLAGYLLIFFFEKVAFDAHDILHEMEHSYQTTNGAANKGEHADGDKAVATHSSGRSAQILLGALAIHSILEMMALGLADSFGDCALLTLSIALHQVSVLVPCCESCSSLPVSYINNLLC